MNEKQTSSGRNREPQQQQQISQASTQNPDVSSPDFLQNTTIVNGQSINQTMPVSGAQIEQMPGQKSSKWRYFFIFLGILQVFGVAIFFLIMAWAIQQANSGVSGTEFIGLILYITLVPSVGIIAFTNLIGLPIYMVKHKPHGKWLVLSILSLFVSAILAIFGAYSVYQLRVAVPKQEKEFTERLRKESYEREQQFAADNAKPEISKGDAISLLKSCQLSGFYYTNQTSKDNGNWGELSSTGVVLTRVEGKPYRISISDRLVSELVPVAREAQKTCRGPQFWHDGRYEQRQSDGTWR